MACEEDVCAESHFHLQVFERALASCFLRPIHSERRIAVSDILNTDQFHLRSTRLSCHKASIFFFGPCDTVCLFFWTAFVSNGSMEICMYSTGIVLSHLSTSVIHIGICACIKSVHNASQIVLDTQVLMKQSWMWINY